MYSTSSSSIVPRFILHQSRLERQVQPHLIARQGLRLADQRCGGLRALQPTTEGRSDPELCPRGSPAHRACPAAPDDPGIDPEWTQAAERALPAHAGVTDRNLIRYTMLNSYRMVAVDLGRTLLLP